MNDKTKKYLTEINDGILIDNNLLSISLIDEPSLSMKYVLKFKDSKSVDIFIINNYQESILENQAFLNEEEFLDYINYIFVYKKAKLREEKINQILNNEL